MFGISLLLLLLIEYKYFYIAVLFTYVLSTIKNSAGDYIRAS